MENRPLELWIKTWDNPNFVFSAWVTLESQYYTLDSLDKEKIKEAIIIAREENNEIKVINYKEYKKEKAK